MSEIEVKVLDVDPDRIRARLLELGATLVKKGRETNRMYDFADQRLWKAGGYVRVREFNGRFTLTYKRRLPGVAYKSSEELETDVADAAMMCREAGAKECPSSIYSVSESVVGRDGE